MRASLVSSACSRPAWWASARRATHSAAVAKATRCPAWQAGGQVGLTGARWPEEDDVVLRGDEVQGAQVGDDLAFEAAGVVEVEFLQALAGGEAGGADAAFPAVGLPGGDFPLQASHQVLLVCPGLRASPLG